MQEFDEYVMDGSVAHVMTGSSETEFLECTAETVKGLKHLKVKFVAGDPTQPTSLQWLKRYFVCYILLELSVM